MTPEQAIANAQARIEAQAAIAKAKARITPQKPGVGEAVVRSGTENFIGNILDIPNIGINAIANMPVPRMVTKMLGKEPPKLSDQTIPTPDVSTIFAGAQRAGETAGLISEAVKGGENLPPITSFKDAKAQQEATSARFREERPVASGAGGLLGDAATVATLRAPAATFLSKHPLVMPNFRNLDPGLLKQLNSVMQSTPVKSLFRVLGRGGEAGLEGATMAVFNDADPLEVAKYSAAANTAGSVITGLSHNIVSSGWTAGTMKLAASVFGLSSLLQVGKEMIPGGRDWYLESLESAHMKVAATLGLGLFSAVAGMGRLRGFDIEKNLPVFADALTALPRGLWTSKLSDILKASDEGNDVPEKVLSKVTEDTEYFGKFMPKINKALTDTKTSYTETVNQLMVDPEFRHMIEGLTALPTAPPELNQ